MTEAGVFDGVARDYDAEFTHTETGKRQRARVRKWLLQHLETPKKILELNCGTGEDALWMARLGHEVTAVDLSAEMIAQARAKATKSPEKAVDFVQADLRAVDTVLAGRQFDLIFSNFGGLNCVSREELAALAEPYARLLAPGGRLIAVVMPRFCMWEHLYFIAKFRFRSAFRRNTSEALMVPLQDGSSQPTWYHRPRDMKAAFRSHFSWVRKRPIGYFLPPSYLDPFFRRRGWLLSALDRMESWVGSWGLLSGLSDHYLVEFKVRP